MTLYNFEGLYKGKKKRNLIFKKWYKSKDDLIAEVKPFDYYNLKVRYSDLKIVEKEE